MTAAGFDVDEFQAEWSRRRAARRVEIRHAWREWRRMPGPWDHEPDRAEWTTAEGVECLVARDLTRGFWCGYVVVPDGHPWREVSEDFGGLPMAATTVFGISFVGELVGRRWGIGFDCNHLHQASPVSLSDGNGGTYATYDEVCAAVAKLARELARWSYSSGGTWPIQGPELGGGDDAHVRTTLRRAVDQFRRLQADQQHAADIGDSAFAEDVGRMARRARALAERCAHQVGWDAALPRWSRADELGGRTPW